MEINGCLDVLVLYGTGIDMRILRGANQEVQFTHRIALPDADNVYVNDVQLTADNSSFDIMSDTELGISADVRIRAHLSRKQEISIVTGVKGVKPADKKKTRRCLYTTPRTVIPCGALPGNTGFQFRR